MSEHQPSSTTGLHGNVLLIGLHGNVLLIGLHGNVLSIGLHGNVLFIGLHGNVLSIGLHGNVLLIGLHGNVLSIGLHRNDAAMPSSSNSSFSPRLLWQEPAPLSTQPRRRVMHSSRSECQQQQLPVSCSVTHCHLTYLTGVSRTFSLSQPFFF